MKTIIIGGVAAGMSAASKLKRLDKSATIHVYEKGTDLSYSGCGMPYYLGDIVTDESQLIARTKEDFEKKGIHVFLAHEVIAVDPDQKTVTVKQLSTNKTITDSYDTLVIGTGTAARYTNVKGSNEIDVYVLNQLTDMRDIHDILPNAKSVAIIGGGYIGVEVAENLRHKGLAVHVIEYSSQLLNIYDKELADQAQNALEEIGVQVHVKEELKSYHKKESNILVTTNQNTYQVDFVIEAIGVIPNTSFLQHLPIDMLPNGAIKINDYCETSIKGIYAAGDCAAYPHRLTKKSVFVPLGTHANKTGRIVANNIAGIPTTFDGIVGSNIVKVADLALAKTGLSLKECNDLNLDCDVVDIKANHKTSYYPGATELFVRFVYDTKTGVIKGAQLAGKDGVADRINIMALAVTKELTASEFAQLDFAYAPPFTPVWDPLLVAANQIKV
jgi:NADPH-dependent 2,4-dienoyl-CoA reductase/sulfur reductase-like enzyme